MPSKTRPPKPKKSYHHGDLRRTLLEASVALLDEHGVDALSLREVARRADVSSAAPYHHFASKAELLGAIAAEGFRALAQAMRDATAGLDEDEDPIARFSALGNAYVAFARTRTSEFRLMFRGGGARSQALPADCRPDEAFSLLVEALEQVARVLPHELQETGALVVTAWSVVHGAAELVLEGPLAHEGGTLAMTPDRVGPTAVATLETMLRVASATR